MKYIIVILALFWAVTANAANWLSSYNEVDAIASGDAFILQDVSDQTSQAYGTTKHVLWSDLVADILASPQFTGDIDTNGGNLLGITTTGFSGNFSNDVSHDSLDELLAVIDGFALNATHTGDVTGSGALTIAADAVEESMLKAVNAPTDEYALTYESTTGDFEWQAITATPEGTAILSTGEAGGVKFLREDGDGTSSWQTVPSSSFDATTIDAVTWSDGANASNVWTFDVSGTDPTITFGSGTVTMGADLALGNNDITGIGTMAVTTLTPTTLQFEGATADAFETTLAVTDPTADRTFTLPDATGTAALVAGDIGAATATTPASGDSDTSVATTAFVADNTAHKIYTEKHAASHTISAAECYQGVHYVTAAATITLPAVADGMSVTIITIGAVAVSVDPDAADLIYLDGTALDDGDKVTNASTAGDIVTLTYFDATGWSASSNGWTDGGA